VFFPSYRRIHDWYQPSRLVITGPISNDRIEQEMGFLPCQASLFLFYIHTSMETQQQINYDRIAGAIEFLRLNFKRQPSLEEAADHVHLSSFHFQRMFREWAGVTPKQFLQYLSLEHAKTLLRETGVSLFEAAQETGLSGTGRLHDLFVKIEGMTPGEYKNGGEQLVINYSFAECLFGKIAVGSTDKGICYMAFADDGEADAQQKLMLIFPNASYRKCSDKIQQDALSIFSQDWSRIDQVKLHLKGTSFQLKVWETLLKIPMGKLTTYSRLASWMRSPNASRAVGTAIGSNPVAFLIPCHRVIKATGEFGEYHWGSTRKTAMIAWEAARIHVR
jgi:AraC family transcriptional regulator, regulatory protein of adaptative response / methylated-DNA-[protein]-cysteine methyltransferase